MRSHHFGRHAVVPGSSVRLSRSRLSLVVVMALVAVFVSGLGVPTITDSAAAAPAAQVYQVPSTIADNCSTDVTSQLQAWLESLPNGEIAAAYGTSITPSPIVVQFARDGCYLVNGSLWLQGWQNVTFEGNGSELKQTNIYSVSYDWGTTAPYQLPLSCYNTGLFGSTHEQPTYTDGTAIMWWVDGGCNLSWRDFNIQGSYGSGTDSSGSPEQDSLIQLNGVENASIEDNTIDNSWGDFVTLFQIYDNQPADNPGYGDSYTWPDVNVTIENNSMSNAERQGITPIYVQNVLIQGNTIAFGGATAFDLEADAGGGCTCDVDINHNTINDTGYAYLIAAFTGTTVNNFAFTNNTVNGPFKVDMQSTYSNYGVPNSANWTIANNTASAPSGYPFPTFDIESPGVSNVLVEGNTEPANNVSDPFVGLSYTGGNIEVADNTLTGTPSVPQQIVGLNWDSGSTGATASECGNSVNGSVVDGTCGSITPPTLPTAPTPVADYPGTYVIVPSNGTYLNGTQVLDGLPVDDIGTSSLQFEITGRTLTDDVVAKGTPTLYGYLAEWNTSTVPDGTYTLQTVACNTAGNCTASQGITIEVDNTPPTTSVLIPSGGASVSGSSVLLDAGASDPGGFLMASVQFELTGGSLSDSVIATGTPTLYGYLVEWNSTAVSDGTYTLQSVAHDPVGLVGVSSGTTITVSN
jgi:Big-like domain-containing protein/parallel beta helix pectate lyase-like protein